MTDDVKTMQAKRQARWLDPERMRLTRTEGGFLNLDYGEEHYERIQIYRCFPFSAPDTYLSIREAGEKAEEIGMLRALEDLGREDQAFVNEQLALRYFTPIIEEVREIKEEYGYSYWDVRTDRGPVRFVVRMGSGTVNRISGDRYLVHDIDGNRFEIPSLNALSVQEQKKLDMFI